MSVACWPRERDCQVSLLTGMVTLPESVSRVIVHSSGLGIGMRTGTPFWSNPNDASETSQPCGIWSRSMTIPLTGFACGQMT